ncbi:MAG: hypothetical protein P1U74_02540 [Legionellaceae bacterium]|nr:hypothetical protein [Legionellaceae bacterium]
MPNQYLISKHRKSKIKSRNKALGTILAAASGVMGPWICLSTGASVALHEVVGHGLLGIGLTSSYPSGSGPTYWVAGFDQFHRMEHAQTPASGIKEFFSWMFVPHSDNGVSGTTSRTSAVQPNGIGNYLGVDGRSAWISIAGSVPGLFVNTLFVSAGMSIRKKHPRMALALIIFGLENSLIEASYAISAACMSNSALRENASHGHDFANFAVRMSSITGMSPSLIAISTALFWTGFVPLIALGIYFYQESHKLDVVSDQFAIEYLITNIKTDEVNLQDKICEFYEKDDFNLLNKSKILKDQLLYEYLIENLPEKLIFDAKIKVLELWQPKLKPSRTEKLLSLSMFLMVAIGISVQIMAILSATILPVLLPAVLVLQSILPVLGVISIACGVYETNKELTCPSIQVPMLAKILSILKLCVTTTMVGLLIVATFVPGMQFIFLPVVLIGSIASLGLGFGKECVIKKAFNHSVRSKSLLLFDNEDTGVDHNNEDRSPPEITEQNSYSATH